MSRVAPRSSIDLERTPAPALTSSSRICTQSYRRGQSSAAQKQDMMRFYVSDDVENDVRRCIRSWERQHSISVTGRTEAGEIKCFSGTVEAVARAPGLATGELWLVTMRESKPTSGLFDGALKLQTPLTLILSEQIRFLKTSCNWAEENEK
jgi:hypothetical protein